MTRRMLASSSTMTIDWFRSGIGVHNFRPMGKSSSKQDRDGKFGAAKDHRKWSFGAGTPSLWCMWTDVPMPHDNADQQLGV